MKQAASQLLIISIFNQVDHNINHSTTSENLGELSIKNGHRHFVSQILL